jgi:hypothetical protein
MQETWPVEPCSFCLLIFQTYPLLKGMNDLDEKAFRLHLEKVHGLQPEIPA